MRQTFETVNPLILLAVKFVPKLSLCGTKAVRHKTARGRLSFRPILEQSKTLQHEEQRRVGFSTWNSLIQSSTPLAYSCLYLTKLCYDNTPSRKPLLLDKMNGL